MGLVWLHYAESERQRAFQAHFESLIAHDLERMLREGLDIHIFENGQELFDHAAKRIKESKKSVDDITWGSAQRQWNQMDQRARNRYLKAIIAVCKKGNTTYREVLSFPHYLNRAETMIAQNMPTYQLKYYEVQETTVIPPILQFMVIDSKEVIIAFYRAPFLLEEREIWLSVQHPKIVELFQDYFDTIWQGATALGENGKNQLTELYKIRQRLIP